MKILISFCNTKGYKYIKDNNISPLALVDTDTSTLSWITLPINKTFIGLTGICASQDKVFVLSQQAHSCVVYILNKITLKLIKKQRLFKVSDPHSIIHKDNSLYIVSTGSDSIVKYKIQNDHLTNPINYYQYRKTTQNSDTIHLNSICDTQNGVIFSAFGNKTGKLKKTAKKGYIYNPIANKKIILPIFHPHSVTAYNHKIYYCQSAKNDISQNGKVIIQLTKGYTRGLIVKNRKICFATSSSRAISKSTGTKNTNVSDQNQNNCRLIEIKKNIFGFNKYKIYNFSKNFNEIYDLLEINDTKKSLTYNLETEINSSIIKYCKLSFK